jgi:uncharacterized protein YjbI with pentapeptide repeats
MNYEEICKKFSLENLRGADLSGADLSGANLTYANLRGADLSGANLRGANLSDANLRGANLSDASLRGADLSGANLTYANLRGANLRGADLSGANLTYANLSGANLRDANLRGANLRGANLSDADLRGAKEIPSLVAAQLFVPPEKGSFTCFKKGSRGEIIELVIPETAKRSSATGRKCRASEAIVVSIDDGQKQYAESGHNSLFIYEVGETVVPSSFDEDRWSECAPGIHFFMTREEAKQY